LTRDATDIAGHLGDLGTDVMRAGEKVEGWVDGLDVLDLQGLQCMAAAMNRASELEFEKALLAWTFLNLAKDLDPSAPEVARTIEVPPAALSLFLTVPRMGRTH